MYSTIPTMAPQYIHKNEDNAEISTKNYTLVIHSKDRNSSLYPNTNNYTVELANPYKDIVSAELLSVHMPQNPYTIVKDYNDKLHVIVDFDAGAEQALIQDTAEFSGFTFEKIICCETSSCEGSDTKTPNPCSCPCVQTANSSQYQPLMLNSNNTGGSATNSFTLNSTTYTYKVYEVTLTPGVYTGASLATEIHDKMENDTSLTFEVTFSSVTNKFTFADANGKFGLLGYNHVKPIGNYEYLRDTDYTYFIKNSGTILLQTKYLNVVEQWLRCNNCANTADNASILQTLQCGGTDSTSVSSHTFSAEYVTRFIGQYERKYPKASVLQTLGFKPVNYYTTANGNLLTSNMEAELTGDPYVVLKIPQFKRYHSNNQNMAKSFALVPFNDQLVDFDHGKEYGKAKGFNPPLPKLEKINVSLYRYGDDKVLYDTNGREHTLILGIKTTAQTNKYYPMKFQD